MELLSVPTLVQILQIGLPGQKHLPSSPVDGRLGRGVCPDYDFMLGRRRTVNSARSPTGCQKGSDEIFHIAPFIPQRAWRDLAKSLIGGGQGRKTPANAVS